MRFGNFSLSLVVARSIIANAATAMTGTALRRGGNNATRAPPTANHQRALRPCT